MAKDIGAPTPQSDNPSPWPTPKVVLPAAPAGLTEQLPTPDQSDGMMVNGLCIVEGIPSDGRGKRLTPDEVRSLARVFMKNTEENDVEHLPKAFWVKVSDQFLRETGRSYSWQSCKRRMSRMVAACQLYRIAISNGKPFENQFLDRDLRDVPEDLRVHILDWLHKMDKKCVEMDRPFIENNLRLEAKSGKRCPDTHEWKKATEEKERLLEREYHRRKHDRVRKWLNSLPPAGKMVSGFHSQDEIERIERGRDARFDPSRQRDRSRSPNREVTKYRQRSPQGRREPQPTTSTPGGKIMRYFQPDRARDSREQELEQPVPENGPRKISSKLQEEWALRLTATIDDIAEEFSDNHMRPLFDNVTAHYNAAERVRRNEIINSACYSLFRNVATMTMEFLAAAGLPTPYNP